jgi:hypothetical protein
MEAIKILVTNRKGGVGKSTIAANLAAYLRLQKDCKVSLIDYDEQSSSSGWINKAPNIGIETFKAQMSYQSMGMTLLSAKTALRKFSAGFDVSISDLTWTPNLSENFMHEFDLILVPTSTSKFELASTEIFILEYVLRNPASFANNRQYMMAVPSRVEASFSPNSLSTNLSTIGKCFITPPVLRSPEIDKFVYEDFFCVSNDAVISEHFCRFGRFVADKIEERRKSIESPPSRLSSIYAGVGKGILVLDRYRKGLKLGPHGKADVAGDDVSEDSVALASLEQSIPKYLMRKN